MLRANFRLRLQADQSFAFKTEVKLAPSCTASKAGAGRTGQICKKKISKTMSAAGDSVLLLDSDNEDGTPSPPKQSRGRPRRNRSRGNVVQTTRQISTRSTRGSGRRSRRVQSNVVTNPTVINVGDIDSDDAYESSKQTAVSVDSRKDGESNIIGIDILAQALGVADNSPFKSLGNISNTSATEEISQGSNIATAATTDSVSDTQCSLEVRDTDISHSLSNAPTDLASSGTACSAPVPKKTVRRGLAKRDAGLSATALSDFAPELPHTAVYTMCVSSSKCAGLFPKQVQAEYASFTSTSETQSESDNFSGSELVPSKTAAAKNSGTTSKEEIPRDEKSSHTEDKDNDDEEDVVALDTPLQLRSPTPPPQHNVKSKGKTKGGRLNQKLSNALQTINNVKGKLEKLGKSTPILKGRSRKMKDVMFGGEEEGLVKIDMIVKVRYLSTVHRISVNLDEPLHCLTSQLCQLVGDVEEHNLSLFLGDQVLELSATPRSLCLSVADILDCHHIKVSEESDGPLAREDSISLVVQCLHKRTKTTISTHKRQPLRCLIEKYAKIMNLKPDSLRLMFDGEDVNPLDTPSKLDMDNLDVVDIIIGR
ncbi:nfatc2-interacting protein [Plakobranchus ocellatus]|uniref:Nfatc2-interacting protein n=1 Tax=Plakobranchus ocellatus TaxID=259542 RepID=A0AAV4DG12_9GAST|nr:nfatc2-interacting protein [Plakobranchus ocellatus]